MHTLQLRFCNRITKVSSSVGICIRKALNFENHMKHQGTLIFTLKFLVSSSYKPTCNFLQKLFLLKASESEGLDRRSVFCIATETGFDTCMYCISICITYRYHVSSLRYFRYFIDIYTRIYSV